MKLFLFGSFLSVFGQALVLLLAGYPRPVSSNNPRAENLIPEWLPDCFSVHHTFDEMFDCLRGYDSEGNCFGFWGFWDMIGCVVDDLLDFDFTKLGDGSFLRYFYNSTRECLDEYVSCINETIHDLIEDIEERYSCVNTTFRNLAECASDHHEECKESCNNTDTWDEDNNPFKNILDANVSGCSGIQDDVISPACEVFECCPQCVLQYELLMECIVNDVLNYTDTPCDFQCPSTTQIRLLSSPDNVEDENEEHLFRKLDGTSTGQDQISDQCTQFMPGLTNRTAHELSTRSQFFMPCLTNEFVNVVESELATDDSGNTPAPAPHPTPAPVTTVGGGNPTGPTGPTPGNPTGPTPGNPTGPTPGNPTGPTQGNPTGPTPGGNGETPAPNASPASSGRASSIKASNAMGDFWFLVSCFLFVVPLF